MSSCSYVKLLMWFRFFDVCCAQSSRHSSFVVNVFREYVLCHCGYFSHVRCVYDFFYHWAMHIYRHKNNYVLVESFPLHHYLFPNICFVLLDHRTHFLRSYIHLLWNHLLPRTLFPTLILLVESFWFVVLLCAPTYSTCPVYFITEQHDFCILLTRN